MVEMQSFLKGILTPAEIKQFYFRVRVISMLKRGFTQREVACGLGVGIATVSRGARELQNGTFDKLRF